MNHYQHVVQYYETDQMQVVHHSNYIRWFEEARTWQMAQSGLSYGQLEAEGVMMPIIAVSAKYLRSMYYEDVATIKTYTTQLKSVRMTITYEVYNQHGEKCVTGSSELAFIDKATGKPVNIMKKHPQMANILQQWYNNYLE